jgi:hypothetical protein
VDSRSTPRPRTTGELTKTDNRFVHFWSIDERDHEDIRSRAVRARLTERATLFEVSWHTDCGRSAFLLTDETRAAGELELLDGDEVPASATVDGLVGTGLLRTRMRHSCGPGIVEDFAVLCYAIDVFGADGLWWEDRCEPAELSGPRAITAARVRTFTARRVT